MAMARFSVVGMRVKNSGTSLFRKRWSIASSTSRCMISFKLLQINDESGARIDLAFHRDFERVVVPVPVGIVALAEDALVLLRSKVRIVIVVRRGEFGFAG